MDDIFLINLKQHVLASDRIADLLSSLTERQAAKSESTDRRLLTLQREVGDTEDRLKRLYRSIKDGIVELDDILRERTATLKSERERAKAALDRARAQCGTVAAIANGAPLRIKLRTLTPLKSQYNFSGAHDCLTSPA
ncbi:hypothetical protein [Bradyrhizobium lablabi]|uniref:hypothetical protein n=1 Tax=Bradyrhizobium lablabi TaxID=722472 RepID=UPI0018D28924|nr:hypothetical protein [Bradyrhizobium lablabi]